MKKESWLIAAAAACALLQPVVATAEEAPAVLVRAYVLVAKPGGGDALHKALKAHGEWRVKNGESWQWHIYTRVAGEGAPDTYVIRSGPKQWADFDAYREFNAKALPHFQRTVSPHVAHSEAHLSRWANDLSNWPEEAGPYSMFWVYDYHLRPGGMRPALAAIGKIGANLKAGGWETVHGWEVNMTGSPSVSLVVPSADWAGFADPAKSAFEVLAEQLGEEAAGKLWHSFFERVKSMDSSIWVEASDLAVTPQS